MEDPNEITISELKFYQYFHYLAFLRSDRSLNVDLFPHQVVLAWYFSRFPIVLSSPKNYHVCAKKLRDVISLDLTLSNYFKTIQLLKDCRVPMFQRGLKTEPRETLVLTLSKN